MFATPRLVAVADGVGGAAAGEVASSAAIHTLQSLETSWLADALPNELEAAIRMATTMTAVAIEDGYVVMAIFGDPTATS